MAFVLDQDRPPVPTPIAAITLFHGRRVGFSVRLSVDVIASGPAASLEFSSASDILDRKHCILWDQGLTAFVPIRFFGLWLAIVIRRTGIGTEQSLDGAFSRDSIRGKPFGLLKSLDGLAG